ncbi:reprolysin-like metallopeptidase [Lacinutrix sp. Hel_I_90]|uniref:reprolysin-like metallopeptidase n=1 Tax=Lacinutrix sp. Hel_I_90 TaxID=1249999 RepID=UPI000698F710|nr:zinc-dependent metalloprotease family protein [Lacinutrix sp. Hel_I_90]
MKKLLLLAFFMSTAFAFSQSKSLWQKKAPAAISQVKASKQNLPTTATYHLNLEGLKQALTKAPKRDSATKNSNVIIAFPNEKGEFESFRIFEASVMHPDLEAKYPGIKSYAGQGISDPSSRIRFSVSPLGLQSMRLSAGKPAAFIEPYTNDGLHYTVYKREDKTTTYDDFECQVTDAANKTLLGNNAAFRNADDSILRTYRLAVSTTAEYTTYHGGTKTLALAAINTTMTRVNGIFENDFNVTMILIANTDAVIYTNASTDPYGSTSGGFNSALQNTLTNVIGEANYDVGHLFAKASNNGNAGCIGCVCVNGQKGSGFTSRQDPEGDPFDVDYVAHELGHQFGGNHTWTHGGNEGTNVQMEPGSGSTIMGYAGITGANTDVQQNSDPYFHAITIEQITDYVKSTSCQINTNTGNAVPTANAGSNYTIPKGTAFVLTGAGSDANSQDVLTYCWEQIDENNSATQKPSVTATTGPAFRSYLPTTNTKRYFPRLATIKTGATAWEWEAVPNVARSLNFRLTVRDNRAGGANNNSDDMAISVNGAAGPFIVNTPNTNVTWNAGTTQSVTWNVAGTTGNGVNAANVDIFLSTDGGNTYPISLATGVPNDGAQDIVVPNNQGSQNRIMVKGANNIFFDISNNNFTIGTPVSCVATVPVSLAASNVGASTATLSWTAVPAATYDLRYRKTGTTTWTTNAVTGTSLALSGLTALTQYEAQVRSKCSGGSNSAYSASVSFTTTQIQLNYCASASTNVNDEYISRVQLGTINNSSGAQFYSDFTAQSTNLAKGSASTITITPTWTGTVYNEAYAVWIDYNKDGDFTDAGEQVFSQAPTQATPVSGTFTVPNTATNGPTRMRVSMKYNAAPAACESFQYGEVEDYTVNIQAGAVDTIAPVITLIGSATINLLVGDSYNDQGATATDNVDGNITSSIVTTGTVNTTVAGTYIITYNVSDAAGNAATPEIRTINVTAVSSGCTAGVSAFPYSESFESGLGAWTQASGDDLNWTRDSGGTPSSNTGPASGSSGSWYVYVEASSPNYPSKRAILNSPCFDLSSVSQANFTFDYHMNGANDLGSISVEASDNDGATWTTIWSESGASQGNAWQSVNLDLANYVGDSVQLRFNRLTGNTWQADIAIDNVGVSSDGGPPPGCSNVTLSFTFDNYPEETAWSIVNGSGSTVASGGTYGSQPDGSTLNIAVGCLDDGCYNLIVTDTYGDGICCAYGNGSYTLTNSDTGVTLASGGAFTSSETTNFCLASSGFASGLASVTTRADNLDQQFKLYPNPVEQELKIALMGFRAQSFEINNMLGQTVIKGRYSDTIDVSKLEAGMYIIQLNIGEKTKIKRFIKE